VATNEYHFITNWRVEGTLREINEILGNGPDLVRWWPSVYLEVKQVQQGDSNGIGAEIDLYTKGWLPYTLRWKARNIETHHPHGWTLQATGDFDGRGIWTFEQDGAFVNLAYDWKLRADKPLLRNLSFIMKPLFSANHRWAMAKGEESLKLELQRRHTKTDAERARIPAPPPPTPTSPVPLLLGTGGVLAVAVAVVYWLVRLVAR
jgi:hypothetical protein